MPADPIIPSTEPKGSDKSGQEATKIEIKVPPAIGASLDEKVRFEADLLTYRALSEVCAKLRIRVDQQIATKLKQPAAGEQTPPQEALQLILLDGVSITAFEAEAAFQDQMVNLKSSFESIASEARDGLAELQETAKVARVVPMAFAASFVPGMATTLTGALSLLKIFQTETAYFGRSVLIPPLALELELAHQWEGKHNLTVFLANLNPGIAADLFRTDIHQRLDEVIAARDTAYKAIHGLSIAMRTIDSHNKKYPATLSALNAAKEQFEAADLVFRQLSATLGTPDETTKLSLMQLLERAARFRNLLGQKDKCSFLLFVEAVTAGGSYRTVKNLLRSVFWADGIEVAGGVLVMYGLFRSDGGLISSGLVSSGKGFLTLRDLWSELDR
jgi:hypothetical protein